MPLTNFNVVLVGQNFPVESINVADFSFRSRRFKELLRIPVAVQAENEWSMIQVFPDRFQAEVKKPDRLDVQCEGIAEVVTTFLEYVGKRTITAVGHNALWVIPGTADSRSEVVGQFLNASAIAASVGDASADLSLTFQRGDAVVRVNIPSSQEGDVALNFNFHREIRDGQVMSAVEMLQDSLQCSKEIAEKIETPVVAAAEQVTP
jgi:hypothetical protein